MLKLFPILMTIYLQVPIMMTYNDCEVNMEFKTNINSEENILLNKHLKRITLWNKKGYKPQEDRFFIENCLWIIEYQIKPLKLLYEQREQIKNELKDINSRKTAYKLINNMVKYIKLNKTT